MSPTALTSWPSWTNSRRRSSGIGCRLGGQLATKRWTVLLPTSMAAKRGAFVTQDRPRSCRNSIRSPGRRHRHSVRRWASSDDLYTAEIGVRSLYLVRHAIARERDGWPQPDRLRPLSELGWRQAVVLADLLADAGGLYVQDDPRLLEGGLALDQPAAEAELKALIKAYFAGGSRRAVACSHGDLLPPLLEAAGAAPSSRCPKGGVWRLDLPDDKDRVSQAVYLGRPDPGGGWDQR